MDWELVFWVVAPFVLIGLVLVTSAVAEYRENKKRRWRREHADDFNKDIWDASWG